MNARARRVPGAQWAICLAVPSALARMAPNSSILNLLQPRQKKADQSAQYSTEAHRRETDKATIDEWCGYRRSDRGGPEDEQYDESRSACVILLCGEDGTVEAHGSSEPEPKVERHEQ